MILKTYHEIAQPVRLLQNVRASMSDDALLGIIDRNGKGDDHGLDRDQVVREAARAGLQADRRAWFCEARRNGYALIFQK
ncbi:MAG: hypothetical protein WKF84_00310 [Pyrinomonadaceae bacterium]